nr:DUF6531 domain-containing protein [Pseudomonas toyotomiensis]
MITTLLAYTLTTQQASGSEYYWSPNLSPEIQAPSPVETYEKYLSKYIQSNPGTLIENYGCSRNSETAYFCRWKYRLASGLTAGNGILIWRRGSRCTAGTYYDEISGRCTSSLGWTPSTECSSNVMKANPINISNGNKFQAETDFEDQHEKELALHRYYNSLRGLWTHSYSTRLYVTDAAVVLVASDGSELHYQNTGERLLPLGVERGSLKKFGSVWIYHDSRGKEFQFNSDGLLEKVVTRGSIANISREGRELLITNGRGKRTVLVEDDSGQLLSFSTPGVQIAYSYNADRRLTSVTRTAGGETTQRHYHYEVPGKPDLLTGITDERGVRYATWTYDDQGRAISSEHADGADNVIVAYNSDGTVSVTNELGKVAKYSFQTIRGVRRIMAIEGEPSPNCPNSNSTFTYDERGLLKTKTDNKGILTTYDYNERGLEVSRTEASGTSQARTITTTWHPDWFLPVTITEPDRITQYTYDNQGRQTSQSVIQR